MAKRSKGEGHLFQRVKGGTWFVQFRNDGKTIVRSTETRVKEEAVSFKNKLVEDAKRGEIPEPVQVKPVTVAELVDDYVLYLQDNHSRSTTIITQVLTKLRNHPVYQDRLAASITSDDNRAYRRSLMKDGAAEATCNRHLSYLRSAFIHAIKRQTPPKLRNKPYFPITKEDNARSGFIEMAEYEVLRKEMSDSIRPFFILGYHWGCRAGELVNLKWRQVDFKQ